MVYKYNFRHNSKGSHSGKILKAKRIPYETIISIRIRSGKMREGIRRELAVLSTRRKSIMDPTGDDVSDTIDLTGKDTGLCRPE